MRLSIIITIPLPPRALSPNARTHFLTKGRAIRKYRQWSKDAARYATGAERFMWERATAEATFYFAQNRRRDRDNFLASLKAAYDGIRDAGVIVDDSGLKHLSVNLEVDANDPRVEIEIIKET